MRSGKISRPDVVLFDGDPADLLLVATAMFHHLDLVSADRVILEFARANPVLSVIDANR